MAKIVIEAIETKMGQDMLSVGTTRRTGPQSKIGAGAAQPPEGVTYEGAKYAADEFTAVVTTLNNLVTDNPEVYELFADAGVSLQYFQKLEKSFQKAAESLKEGSSVSEASMKSMLGALGDKFKKALDKVKSMKGDKEEGVAAIQIVQQSALPARISSAEKALAGLRKSDVTRDGESALKLLRALFDLEGSSYYGAAEATAQTRGELQQQQPSSVAAAMQRTADSYMSDAGYKILNQLSNFDNLDREQRKELLKLLNDVAFAVEREGGRQQNESAPRVTITIKDR